MKILFAAPVAFNRTTFFISQYTIGLAKAAKSIGHEVKVIKTTENIYNPYLWNFIKKGFIKEFNIFRILLKPIIDLPHDVLLFNQLLSEVKSFKPDIMFIYLIDTYYIPFFMHKIKKMGIKTFTWLGLHPFMVSSGVIRLIRSCDYTFIYDQEYIKHFNSMNIYNVSVVPLGCDVSFFDSVQPDEQFRTKYGVDVCFVGLFDKYREKFLNALTNFNLGIWSWNIYDYKTSLIKYNRGVVYGENLVKVLKSAKIALNIHREFEKSGGNYRLFEISASGTFQIVDHKNNIKNYFDIGKEIETFKDKDDLIEKVKYYLEHPDEREKIAKAGYERVKRDHSLVDRIKKMLDIICK